MRAFQAGILLILAMSTAAFGQAEGFVEAIGFDRAYRPECWTPMLVNLRSTLSEPAEYDVHVEQEDLDGDTVVYTRRVTLNAGQQEKFWVYFLPRTNVNSLPANNGDLQKALRVGLYTPDGKLVTPLPLTTLVTNVDDAATGSVASRRDVKLVLVVAGQDGAMPGVREYDGALGLIEDVQFVRVGTADLPESAIGYDSVDAVLWLGADAADLTRGGSRKLPALDRYVRGGGHLVVCHPNERARVEVLADLLPVVLKQGDDWAVELRDLRVPEPLHTIAVEGDRLVTDRWGQLPGPFKVARAQPKPEALVDYWIDWKTPAKSGPTRPAAAAAGGDAPTPYIARLGRGSGAVTWVAQDLSNPGVHGPNAQGWAQVWDRVFGWENDTYPAGYVGTLRQSDKPSERAAGEKIEQLYRAGSGVDLGKSVLAGTDHTGKAGAYVLLAVFFFIAYWVIAGPGTYVFLAGKRRPQFSWAAFAVTALAATALTVGVVNLVLRGDPEVKHFTIVRQAPGEETIAISRIGLYIPRDGMQTVTVPGVSPDAVSTIHAAVVHPKHLNPREGFLDTGRYTIPVRDDNAGGDAVSVEFPYRSTLKKIQVERVGPLSAGPSTAGDAGGDAGVAPATPTAGGGGVSLGGVDTVAIVPARSEADPRSGRSLQRGYIKGRLVNNTGGDLHNVFVAFRYDERQSWMFYVPYWAKAAPLELEVARGEASNLPIGNPPSFDSLSLKSYRGPLVGSWDRYFLEQLESSASKLGVEVSLTDAQGASPRVFLAMMSLFDRIPPKKYEVNLERSRIELVRREGRELDLSPALAAGRVIVLAEARDRPLPFDLEVEGDKVPGQGTVYYQFVLNADRTAMAAVTADEDAEEAGTDAPQPQVEQQ